MRSASIRRLSSIGHPSSPRATRAKPKIVQITATTQHTPEPSQLPHHLAAKAVDRAFAGQHHESHLAGLARLEAYRGAGRDVEPHAARLLAIELQRRIGLEEVVVRADLDRPIAAVGDRQGHGLTAGIELDLAVLDEEFAGDHVALLA